MSYAPRVAPRTPHPVFSAAKSFTSKGAPLRVLIAAPPELAARARHALASAGCAVVERDASTIDVVWCDEELPDHELREAVTVATRTSAVAIFVVGAYSATALGRAVRFAADAVVPRDAPIAQMQHHVRTVRAGRRDAESPAARPTPILIGRGAAMERVSALIALAAGSSSSVLVTGETGTGKELVARMLHELSPRRNQPFIAVSCAALPEGLLESELFGHERGAFTGAAAPRKGRFELAHRGTLFLDEIAELPPAMQVKLLRVLQERSLERLGSNTSMALDVRIVSATNRSLEDAMARAEVRSDLFYRLNTLGIHLPPLREREDVATLWTHFLCRSGMNPEHAEPTHDVLAALLSHRWPGNVRELENAAAHALMLSAGKPIRVEHLPPVFAKAPVDARGVARAIVPGSSMAVIERDAIEKTIAAAGGVKAAADILGISERTVRSRIAEYRREDAERMGAAAGARATSVSVAPRVFLVDDDLDFRGDVATSLTDSGCVVETSDGSDALARVRAGCVRGDARTIDVIVTDLYLLATTGIDVLMAARECDPHLPVILISGRLDEETARNARALQATAILEKPFEIADLVRLTSGVEMHRW